jgi:ribosomal RNA-processing protein 17
MFAHPRPKKSLHLSSTRRHRVSTTEEVKFDFNARADFLTGFHKRKQERAKKGKEEAAKKAREERIAARKRVRFL